MREKDIFAAGGARDGGFRASARCPGQGWDGPGRKAGVFVIQRETFPQSTFVLVKTKLLSHIIKYKHTVGNNIEYLR